jgi:hypothetical protein
LVSPPLILAVAAQLGVFCACPSANHPSCTVLSPCDNMHPRFHPLHPALIAATHTGKTAATPPAGVHPRVTLVIPMTRWCKMMTITQRSMKMTNMSQV